MQELSLKIGKYELTAAVSGMSADARIALKPLCEAVGLDWKSQSVRVKSNPQFSYGAITTTGSDGKRYEMLTIPVCEVGMFLCTVNANRVRPEIRDRLIQFQRHLQVVIHDAITGRVDRGLVDRLVKQIEMMASAIAQLQAEVVELRADRDAREILDRSQARAAGVMLSAQRRANEVRVVH